MKKIPVTVIIGQKEVDEETISYRLYGTEETTTVTVNEFIKYVQDRINNKE